MVLTRKEFIDYCNAVDPNLGDEGSPLWEAESGMKEPCQYFIYVDSIIWDLKSNYWNWITENCKESVRYFASSGSIDQRGKQWWGFTHKDDIIFWTLKWLDTD